MSSSARPSFVVNVVKPRPSQRDKPPPRVPSQTLPKRSEAIARTPSLASPSAVVNVRHCPSSPRPPMAQRATPERRVPTQSSPRGVT